MKLEYAKVIFLKEWMGHPVESSLTILKPKALELESRGVVEIVLAPEVKNKEIEKPNVNKMIEKPVEKKAGRPRKE